MKKFILGFLLGILTTLPTVHNWITYKVAYMLASASFRYEIIDLRDKCK